MGQPALKYDYLSSLRASKNESANSNSYASQASSYTPVNNNLGYGEENNSAEQSSQNTGIPEPHLENENNVIDFRRELAMRRQQGLRNRDKFMAGGFAERAQREQKTNKAESLTTTEEEDEQYSNSMAKKSAKTTKDIAAAIVKKKIAKQVSRFTSSIANSTIWTSIFAIPVDFGLSYFSYGLATFSLIFFPNFIFSPKEVKEIGLPSMNVKTLSGWYTVLTILSYITVAIILFLTAIALFVIMLMILARVVKELGFLCPFFLGKYLCSVGA